MKETYQPKTSGLPVTLARVQDEIARQSPFGQWQVITVTFPSSADTDIDIRHDLKVARPENVHYLVVQQSGDGTVYHDTSATRKPWPKGTLILRASAANLKATLLIVTLNLTVQPSLVR